MNLGQMLFNGKCKVFAPFYYIPMEIGIKYFLQGNFSIKIILKSATTRLYDTEAKIICIVSKKGAQCIECHHKDI